MTKTWELDERVVVARPDAEDPVLEAMVGNRLFGAGQVAPAKIDRFTLLERVGRGGTGDVYAAYDPVLDRKVALKLLRTDRPQLGERAWLLREARAAARLSHPNVVAIHEVGELGPTGGDGIYVAMEFVDGVTLRAWLRERRSLAQILDVFVQAGLGLAAAHAAGVIHRDFKPENVLVCERDSGLRAHVVDFGLARVADLELADAGAPGSKRHSTVAGTPAYMSPEQLRGDAIDTRSDQFSFCVALCEALTGVHPFGADQPGATPDRILEQIVAGERSTGERALPAWLRRILRRGLSPNPSDRYPSMTIMIGLLRATPARRKRRASAMVVAALLVATAVFASTSQETSEVSSCANAAAELDGVWDVWVRARVRGAFAEAKLVNAEEVWKRLEPRLDDYAQAWISSREQNCVAQLGDLALSPALAQLRQQCLDRRRAELQGLTELLAVGEQTAILPALRAVDQLTPIAHCDDIESLRREPSGDDDVEALRQEIARRMTQARAGQERSLGSVVAELITTARTLDSPTALAEALYLEAIVAEALGDYENAAASLETGVLEAVAARHDRVHAEAATRLVWVHGVRLGSVNTAEEWRVRAEAAIRANRGDPILAARLLDHRGAIAGLGQDAAGAARMHAEAIEILQSLSPQADAELTAVMGNLGLALLLQGKTDEATPMIRESLVRYRERFGPNHPDVATMLSNLGEAYVRAGEYERGLASLQEALALRQRLFGSDHVALLGTLNGLGNAYSSLGRSEDACAAWQRALTIAEHNYGAESQQLGIYLHNLAFESWVVGNHEAVVRYAERSLALQRQRYGETHPILALTLELLARGQLGMSEHEAAMVSIERALELAEAGTLTPSEQGNVLLSAAWIERAIGGDAQRVHARALAAKQLLGDDPNTAAELTELLDP